MISIAGSTKHSQASRVSPIPLWPSDMRSRDGVRSVAFSTTVTSKWTTRPPNGLCASSPSVARTISSLDQTRVANAPQPSTVCSARPSSTDSIRSFTCATSWSASPIIQLTAFTNSCPGIWRLRLQRISLKRQVSTSLHHRRPRDYANAPSARFDRGLVESSKLA